MNLALSLGRAVLRPRQTASLLRGDVRRRPILQARAAVWGTPAASGAYAASKEPNYIYSEALIRPQRPGSFAAKKGNAGRSTQADACARRATIMRPSREGIPISATLLSPLLGAEKGCAAITPCATQPEARTRTLGAGVGVICPVVEKERAGGPLGECFYCNIATRDSYVGGGKIPLVRRTRRSAQ